MRAPLVFPSTLFGALLVLSGCDKGATPAPPPPWSPGDASVPVRPGVKADASVEASAGDARVSADSGGRRPHDRGQRGRRSRDHGRWRRFR